MMRSDFVGKHLVVIVKCVMEATGLRRYVSTVYLSRSVYAKGRVVWEKMEQRQLVSVAYDQQSDILTFTFTPTPQPALAEEAADDIWVRYDPKTHQVITVDV